MTGGEPLRVSAEASGATRRYTAIDLVAFLILLHAGMTAAHFTLLLSGTMRAHGGYQSLVEFAAADTAATIIPSLAAALGLFWRRWWGWALSLLVAGGYLHGMVILIVRGASPDDSGVMTYVAGYFLIGTVALLIFLARSRRAFGL